ncbi:MAG TPA: glycine cleavage system protein GcvH [Coleofasciculaceae cyanobacterium]
MALTFPDDLKYSDSHEYLRVTGDRATMGITAFAIDELGDIVFVELPAVGTVLQKDDSFGTVESVKAVSDLYAMVSGEVVAVNQAIVDSPESLADDPYGAGWLIEVRMSDPSEADRAMSAESYNSLVAGV